MVLFYFMWGLIVVYLNFISAKFATKRSKLLHDIPLPDLLHDTFPKIHKHVPDYLLLFCASLMIYYRPNLKEALRLLCSLSLRPIFICLTTFPTCFQEAENEENTSFYSKLFLSKHDLMFSGHTCCFLFFGHTINSICIKYLFPLTLIASRQHYTIDVIVAMLVYSNIPILM